MKIAIIGAGFTGLSAAYQLTKQGHEVFVFEKDSQPGGLALGYKKKEWDWTLENYYHHWFTNDHAILSLAKEIGHNVLVRRPKTCVYIAGESYQLDSALSLLTFPKLPFWDKVRMAETLAILKFNPFWKHMEKVKATQFLPKVMGEKAYKMIWEPLFVNKFGDYADVISLAWFWARITKRTPSLAYPEGGFLSFAKALEKKVRDQGGHITYSSSVSHIGEVDGKTIVTHDGEKEIFDKIIVTIPSFHFLKITPQLPEDYRKKLEKLQGIGAMTVVLRLKNTFLKDKTYWLNICDPAAPITAVVEHTNFMDKKHYNNEHILYLGNYLPTEHPYFSMTEKQLMNEFDPFLEKLNPSYKKHIIGIDVFRVPFAQPIIATNYSKLIPPLTTPLNNVFLANMQQVYPWDRGTNYAVELGEKIAQLAANS
ncbi:MAG TPA: NAD(P)/FAD-dependent oxidoreductase [Patescibacteria group bacterium]|nr:NAD(P)/FAD-dependent oxidoreductase [Patescibacteria group bacterium]